ncbi:MAG: hypothetical protein RSC99_06375 [Clostridiales bacterium]
MKWTEEAISDLKAMCHEGVPNTLMAEYFNCPIQEIYVKCSSLGITIGGCMGHKPTNLKRGLHPDVKTAFDKLQQELLVRMASDFTDEKETEIYGMCGDIIANVEDLINKALKNR